MSALLYMLGIAVGFGYRTLRALQIDRPREYLRGLVEGQRIGWEAGVQYGRRDHAATDGPDEYGDISERHTDGIAGGENLQ